MKHLKKIESQGFLRIKDLAEIITRQFGEFATEHYDAILEALIEAYKENGDDGVIELFKEGTKVDIIPMGYGRYLIK